MPLFENRPYAPNAFAPPMGSARPAGNILKLPKLDALRDAVPAPIAKIGQDVAPLFTSQVTGSAFGDALVGGVIGGALAAPDMTSRLWGAGVGALATGIGGVFGLLGTTGYLFWQNQNAWAHRKA